jgi:23S rRNA (adenine2503-C2)-methyltransferase
VSLNAATDEVRSRLMPVNRAYPLARLMEALGYYSGRTGKPVTIEYVLLKGVNDSNEDAVRLAELLDGLPCMINLLVFNPYPGCAFERPENERVSVFRDILVSRGRVAVVRRSRGRDIAAACGQLRASASLPPPPLR